MATPIPTDLIDAMRHWGPRWHHDITAGRDAMLTAWAPLLAQAPPSLVAAANLPYGSDARQVLDVHAAPSAWQAPVLVFVHGGAFVRGDKHVTPRVYANVADEFARAGFVAMNVEYRLAPDAAWPEGARDVAAALCWVQQHAAHWGGDARRVFLMGHSAGCSHCASAVWDARARPDAAALPQGLILISPRVATDQRPDNPNAHGVRAYCGDEQARYVDRSPMYHTRADAPPTFIAIAQYENPLLEFQAFELAHRLAQLADQSGGPLPRLMQCLDHNHTSIVAQFDTPHNALGEDIRDWCQRVLRGELGARQAN
ncbi:alpha/beta hydrolase [Pseudomonas sp.]|uniref:alpha/beta hydrolase n=1 Tax=Pseudomonas sp. TaxID=306 RepID=UPI0026DB3827|nr:alpha/beta hydrolase fold domain-containing protein [Pseudomonas sp.]MDO4236726.1 alpha/beta hydrolase fold domain-containing protein [Pseudomonas sp.]